MSINKIRTIFIGTPDFGIPSMKALIKDRHFDIVAVITQPDKKIGRKQILTPPPIKVEAKKYRIPVFQPKQIADLQSKICNLKFEIIVVIAYAQLIPKEILDLPKYGCINIHGSLLPKYRGAACIQAAILNGDKNTGVTIIKMDVGLDTGPILAQKNINIQSPDTAGALYNNLSIIGAELLIPTLKKYITGKIKPQPQNKGQASYAKKIKKQDGLIDWTKSAEAIERFIRAMAPWPSAFAMIESRPTSANAMAGKQQKAESMPILKITQTEYKPLKINEYKIGEIFLHNDKLAIQCGRNALVIKKMQLSGKKEMIAEEFIRGHSNFIGTILQSI